MAEGTPALKNPFEGMEIGDAEVKAKFEKSLVAINIVLIQSDIQRALLAVLSVAHVETEDGKKPSDVLKRVLVSLGGNWAKSHSVVVPDRGLIPWATGVENVKYSAMCKVFNNLLGTCDEDVKVFFLALALQFDNLSTPLESSASSEKFKDMACSIWANMGHSDRAIMKGAARAMSLAPYVSHIGVRILAMIKEQEVKEKAEKERKIV